MPTTPPASATASCRIFGRRTPHFIFRPQLSPDCRLRGQLGACRDRLGEIRAPTLVVAGSEDPFYTPELFRETAAGISDARLLLIEGMGHPASGRRFREAVRSFLLEA